MVSRVRQGGALAWLALLAALAILGTVACRSEIVVRLATVVFRDGSLERTIEVRGRTAENAVPDEPEWLSKSVGITLADPEAWGSVEHFPDGLRAEGFFADAGLLPGLLAFASGGRQRSGSTHTEVTIDDRVAATRWSFVERHGDPFVADATAQALDALIDLAAEALRTEVRRELGEGVDPAAAERFLREEVRSLLGALFSVQRGDPGWARAGQRLERSRAVLGQHGVPAVTDVEEDAFWKEELPAVLDWGRTEVARRLSTPDAPVSAHDLAFWPAGEDWEETAQVLVERVWGGEEALLERVEPHLGALTGYYGTDSAPRMRYEIVVRLPGTVLSTNGTPDGEDTARWLVREEDVNLRETFLRVESVELNVEELTTLGARRDLDTGELLRLADLLWRRDPEGLLAELLRAAVGEGSLDRLRNDDTELAPLARELADLLAP